MKTNLARAYDYDYGYDYVRSDPTAFYGELFSDHRPGTSVYGGIPAVSSPEPELHLPDTRHRHDSPERKKADSRFSRPATMHIARVERGIIIFIAVFIAAVLIGVVALEALSVSIQHSINKTASQTAAVQKEIDDLYVEIEAGQGIAALEKSARKDLGMIYPSSDQIKYADDIGAADKDVDIAQDIRSKAYGT